MEKKKPFLRKKVLFSLALITSFLLVAAVADANRAGMSFNELQRPPPKPALLPGQVSETYPVGFYGLTFNADGKNTLELDLGAAQTAGAEVTTYPDRVEIYQHSSPEVRITFRGTGFEYRDGKLYGTVTAADFVTSPLTGTISGGDVTGSIRVRLLALSGRADCTNMIDANVTADVESLFSSTAAAHDRGYNGTAFTFNVTKLNLDRTGSADLTFTIPSQWVASRGGIADLFVVRISERDHAAQLLNISYLGEDSAGTMKFSVTSPDGTSIFGIIAAKSQLGHGIEPFKGQLSTDIGLLSWFSQLVSGNLYLLGAGAVTATGVVYLSRKRMKGD